MTERSYPWPAQTVSEEGWRDFYTYIAGSGVLDGRGDELAVAEATPVPLLEVVLSSGQAMVGGWFYDNDADLTIAVTGNGSGSARVDTLVLRRDLATNSVEAVIVEGTPGAGAPALETDPLGDVFDVPLYDIAVANGVAQIFDADLTDRRTLRAGPLDRNDYDPSLEVAKDGSLVGTRGRLNLIEGSGITLTVADDPGNEEVDVTVAASGAVIATGTYTGTGAASRTITLPFTPLWVFLIRNTAPANDVLVFSSSSPGSTSAADYGVAGGNYGGTYRAESSDLVSRRPLATTNGFTVGDSGAGSNNTNESGIAYRYVAFA